MAPAAVSLSHRGRVRAHNEDVVLVAANERLLACADGLGGLPAGETAAAVAVSHLEEALAPHLAAGLRRAGERAWRERLRRAFLGAHAAVVAAGESSPETAGMATTLVAAVLTPRRAYIGHVGDVRAYASSRGRMTRLTDDHSLVYDRYRAGELDIEEARRHPQRNIVTQAIGLPEGLVPATTVVKIRSDDLLLLCSDGLWETFAEDELAGVLAQTGPDARGLVRTADMLLAHALDAGGADNISLVLYRH